LFAISFISFRSTLSIFFKEKLSMKLLKGRTEMNRKSEISQFSGGIKRRLKI
jgi:hypothetical protein